MLHAREDLIKIKKDRNKQKESSKLSSGSLFIYINNVLPCACEFVEEADIVFGEHSEVLYLILQVRDTLDTHTKSIAGINLAIDSICIKNSRVYHAATKYLYPTSMFAERTALTATKMATDIPLCTRLCKGEITWAKTYLCVRSEHLLREEKKHLLQVCEAHVLVDIESFNLMEEAVGTGCDGLIAIDAAWADDADGRRQLAVLIMHLLHDTSLYARGV